MYGSVRRRAAGSAEGVRRPPPAWFDSGMPDEPEEGSPEADEILGEQRALIASVEELRALLAPLQEEDRALVLDLARRLAHPAAES
jgi:hypothetical protein